MNSSAGPGRRANIFVAIAVFVTLLAVLVPACIWLASEAIIERRYPLASTNVHAGMTPKELARGAHLMAIAGCADCHGADLEGRLVGTRPLALYSGNLLRDARSMNDGELERAIRYAIAPEATTEWMMPSASFKYLSADDVESIISYLRSRPPRGALRPVPRFDFAARWALLKGDIKPGFLATLDSPASLDLGPRYDGGRYLARVTCGECHGTDLKGQGYAPDLDVVARYNRPAFFELLRRGVGYGGRMLPAMHRLARVRFQALADYEIMALYDYLDARAHAPADVVAKAEALRRHEESTRALTNAPE